MSNYREILREVHNLSYYKLKDIVYLITDVEQRPYIITGIVFNPNGILYEVSNNGDVFKVFPCEISTEKQIF